MRGLVLVGMLFAGGYAAATAEETPPIEDGVLIEACLKQVAATFELPEGLSAEVLRPSCECVAREATTPEMRAQLLASTATGDEVDRAAATSEEGRLLLRKCFNVEEPG